MTIRVNKFEISSSIFHHTCSMFYRVLLINVSKTGNTNNFSKTEFMVQRTKLIRYNGVIFNGFQV